MTESRAELAVDISKRFMDLLQQLEPKWTTGYLRFRLDPTQDGCAASYQMGSEVRRIDAIENHQFFSHVSGQARKFFQNLGKTRGIVILVADSSSKYNFYFEFEDLDRWAISTTDGAPGVPTDLPG